MKNSVSLSVKLKTVSVFRSALCGGSGILPALVSLAEALDDKNLARLNASLYAAFIPKDPGENSEIDDVALEAEEKVFACICADLYSCLTGDGTKPQTLSEKVFSELARDENPLSKAILRGETVSRELLERAEKEYGYICELCSVSPECFADKFSKEFLALLPEWKTGAKIKPFSALVNSYRKNGCGVFYDREAFAWDEKAKKLIPVKSINTIKLSDLKEYAEEKQVVINNTTAFLKNLPANNVLLYGDRGTGKSSTVHAILNEYSKDGLRLVEMNKSAITDFPQLVSAISAAKRFKFIIFIDDLSFSDGENDYAQLKAALEGSISKTPNILIYATTNRRHLIKETHADRRGDDVHVNDTAQEQLSLSDRFGLVVTFINPDKYEFRTILKAILRDRNIDCFDDETLSLYAERYAIKKGGRSPRAARQLADIIETSIKTGTEIAF